MMLKKSIFAFIILLLAAISLYPQQIGEAAGETTQFGNSLTGFGCNISDITGTYQTTVDTSGLYYTAWLATAGGNIYENALQNIFYSAGLNNDTWHMTPANGVGPTSPYPIVPDAMIVYTVSVMDSSMNLLAADTMCIDSCNSGIVIPCPESVRSSTGDGCFTDGRINRCDAGSLIVVYGHDYDNGRGLLIRDVEGNNLLLVTPDLIADVPECPDSNTLIAAENDVEVYRLAGSCQFQVNAPAMDGKNYTLIFDDLHANIGYTSHEE